MSTYQEKITTHIKRQKSQYEVTEQASNLDVADMFELSNIEFKTSVIDMLSALMEERTACKNRWVI